MTTLSFEDFGPERGLSDQLLNCCLMLGIACSASIGGIGALIGIPPNALMAAFLKDNYNIDISFAKWSVMALPLVVVFVPLVWFLLTRIIFPIRIPSVPGGRALIRKELEDHGPLSHGELMVKHGVFALTWEQARKLPSGILILFGSSLSLAAALKTSGVTEFIGRSVNGLEGLPGWGMVLVAAAVPAMASELTSNTASTAILLPMFAAVAEGCGIDPLLMIVPATIAASFAFMNPTKCTDICIG